MAAAKAVHATIVMVGLDSSVEAEGLDRVDLLLPGYQTQLSTNLFAQQNDNHKLPLTWYEAGYVKMLPMKSMPLRPIDTLGYPGRTYKLLNGSTVYPFGYGLSYTQFNYTLIAAVEVKHVGKRDRSEVVFVYSKPPDGIVGTHAKQVIGFERVFAKAGQRMEVEIVKALPEVEDFGEFKFGAMRFKV
ncbi:hypothetical protein DVH24_011318 [Malus domestica]|uniref:Fibronectin type III-like domain-containing protein n=1 Tax=Malus domestica TaxID=3750 RepID=A0A498JYB2_MALDO|nr:hypothetical protein DVH24_011318 [Malus domestica]